MAVATYTRRQIVDMLPEFLTKRSATLSPLAEAFAKDAGLSRDVLGGLAGAAFFREGDIVRRERYVWRSPYAIKRGIDQGWAGAVAAGLAERIEGGWRLSPRAMEIMEGWHRRVRDHMRSFALSGDATKRAADAAEAVAAKIPSSAERSALTRRLAPKPGEPPSDLMRLSVAVYALWYFRDDCHISAWESNGYEGPVFDVLSYMWPGRPDMQWTKLPGATSLDALAEALKDRQDRADVDRAIETLVKRGDVQRDGDSVRLTTNGQAARDAVEDETDRRFFAVWHLDDAATARLGEDLRAVIDGLPKAS